jgi:hypothetical protein
MLKQLIFYTDSYIVLTPLCNLLCDNLIIFFIRNAVII